MRTKLLSAIAVATLSLTSLPSVSAQNAVLAQLYGEGVHAYYSCNYQEARELLSMAINNGSKDPRAYYFRGMVAYAQGNTFEAESDWQQGAQLEAQGKTNPFVGRSLTRFQGQGRLKLEQIRQQARLQAMATQAARSNQRIGEIEGSGIRNTVINPQTTPPTPPTVIPDDAAPAAGAPAEAAGAPAPPPAADDPFAGDLAEGDANVTKDDALEGAMDDPFADEPAAATGDAPADGGSDPFGGGDDTAADPFGGGDNSPPAGDADPFGGGDTSPPADDADPFGDASGDDPFGE